MRAGTHALATDARAPGWQARTACDRQFCRTIVIQDAYPRGGLKPARAVVRLGIQP